MGTFLFEKLQMKGGHYSIRVNEPTQMVKETPNDDVKFNVDLRIVQ